MALNPKLNVYVVTLNPKDKSSNPTYRDLFRTKYAVNTQVSDADVKKLFFKDFLNTIGTNTYRKDQKNKKVIGVSEYDNASHNSSLSLLSDRDVIEGIIDGGQYGVLRALANVDDKENKTTLAADNAVLDKFYICLCTPYNSKYGFLFIQSYTEMSIQEPIYSFIRDVLKYDEEYFAVRIEPFVPQKFVNKYKETATIRMFSYRSKIGVSSVMRDNQTLLRSQAFNVEVKITPIEDHFTPDTVSLEALKQALAAKEFDGVELGDYESQKIHVSDNNNHNAHFDITKDIQSIKPTIYLVDEGVEVNQETGQPVFSQIKTFVLSLLEEVKQEYNSYGEIDEL